MESARVRSQCVLVEKILMSRHAFFTYAVGECECPGRASPKKKAASRPHDFELVRRKLSARFAVDIDHDAASGGRARLHMMQNATKMISDLPIFRTRVRLDGGAALNILAVHLRSAATDIRADCCPGYCAAGSGHIPAASATDLVPEHAANHGPGNRTRYIGRIAAILDDLLALDPAALLRRADHCADRRDRHFV